MSLQADDQASAENAVAPRVAVSDIEDRIAQMQFFTVGEAVRSINKTEDVPEAFDLMTVAVLLMKNGFTVIGKSAPASPQNFNAELGRKFAYENAVREAWQLEGYLLRERLSKETSNG